VVVWWCVLIVWSHCRRYTVASTDCSHILGGKFYHVWLCGCTVVCVDGVVTLCVDGVVTLCVDGAVTLCVDGVVTPCVDGVVTLCVDGVVTLPALHCCKHRLLTYFQIRLRSEYLCLRV